MQNTHISDQFRKLHTAMLDIMSVINRPQRDDALIREAGIPLDRALFPLLVMIDKFGPIGVVDMAERIGRDHTTVSRQLARLESLDLVSRQAGATDRRVREAIIAPKGKAMTDALDSARVRIGGAILKDWPVEDIDELARLMQKFAAALNEDLPGEG